MIRKRGEHGVIILTAIFFLIFLRIACNYFIISSDNAITETLLQSKTAEISAGKSEGTIYDRNMKPIVNAEKKYVAAVVPSAVNKEKTAEYAVDEKKFLEDYEKGEPFSFECRADTPQSEGLTVFELERRYSDDQPAQHIIGYTADDTGVAGLEYAYDKILRGDYRDNKVIYSADGFGRVLIGDGKVIEKSDASKSGVVTTIDLDLQKTCESVGSRMKKGAIVLADTSSGDILAMASFPRYSAVDIENAVNAENSPMINRALYSYSVGSIFKLVTACEALNEEKGREIYDCTGFINVEGQSFNCHKHEGHGKIDMPDAIKGSCNPYFIDISRKLDVSAFRSLAYSFGFGRENVLCAGVIGSAGTLPSVKELDIPAELANFSFGQGRLSATPLQITQLTCAIANEGKMPVLRLIKGVTLDGKKAANEKIPYYSTVMDEKTAQRLKNMMIYAVMTSETSNARIQNMLVGAKTSTAQTGRFDKNGNEYCHAWITGFFPAENPKYALTVLVEDGGYGNDAAAPLFAEIAEKIAGEHKTRKSD